MYFFFFFINRYCRNWDPKKDEILKKKVIKELQDLEDFLTDEDKPEGPFLCGKQLSLADCNLLPKLHHVKVAGYEFKVRTCGVCGICNQDPYPMGTSVPSKDICRAKLAQHFGTLTQQILWKGVKKMLFFFFLIVANFQSKLMIFVQGPL